MRTPCVLVILFLTLSYSTLAQKKTSLLFLKAKGTFSYPIKNVSEINTYSIRKNICDGDFGSKKTVFYTDSSCVVSAVFNGKVRTVTMVEDFYVIITEFEGYFLTYSGVIDPIVKKGDSIKTGQLISSTGKDLDDRFCVEIYLSTATKDIDPFPWFKSK